jgi:DNA-binding CsgD family transcriptional regulator
MNNLHKTTSHKTAPPKTRYNRPSLSYLVDEIIDLYNSGLNVTQVARKLDISRGTVLKYLPGNIKRRSGHKRGPLDIKRERKIISHYRDHMTLREIGGIFGISYERVRQIIVRFEEMSGTRLERNTRWTVRK